MTAHRTLVEDVLAAVAIVSPTSFTWFGTRSGELPAEITAAMDADTARAYLVHQLQAVLYGDCYCTGVPRPSLADARTTPVLGPSSFVEELSAANGSRGGREGGWALVRHDDGQLVVERGGLRIWARPDEVSLTEQRTGARAVVQMPKELLRLSPGFYMALGEAEFPADGATPLVRCYWNLSSSAAAQLIRLLTRRLNEQGLAFRVKVVADPDAYTRCDSGVLYTTAREWPDVAPTVAAVYKQLAGSLGTSVPAFTRPLEPGLAFAEDPPGGLTSFGTTRCLLLAEGIVRGAEQGAATTAERVAAVESSFSAAGIDLDAPHLNPGGVDRYEWRA